MAFITLAGTTYEALTNGTAEDDPDIGGASRRTFDGTDRSTVAWEKRAWTFPLAPMTPAAYETFRAAYGLMPTVAVAGTSMPAGGRNCKVKITGATYVPNATDHVRLVTIRVSEA